MAGEIGNRDWMMDLQADAAQIQHILDTNERVLLVALEKRKRGEQLSIAECVIMLEGIQLCKKLMGVKSILD